MYDSATPWTVARQAPLSMGFSRQEYWSGLPSPSPFQTNSSCSCKLEQGRGWGLLRPLPSPRRKCSFFVSWDQSAVFVSPGPFRVPCSSPLGGSVVPRLHILNCLYLVNIWSLSSLSSNGGLLHPFACFFLRWGLDVGEIVVISSSQCFEDNA